MDGMKTEHNRNNGYKREVIESAAQSLAAMPAPVRDLTMIEALDVLASEAKKKLDEGHTLQGICEHLEGLGIKTYPRAVRAAITRLEGKRHAGGKRGRKAKSKTTASPGAQSAQA